MKLMLLNTVRKWSRVRNNYKLVGVEWGEKANVKVLLVYDNYGTCGLYSDNSFKTVGYD